jgi:hypothetical protein
MFATSAVPVIVRPSTSYWPKYPVGTWFGGVEPTGVPFVPQQSPERKRPKLTDHWHVRQVIT